MAKGVHGCVFILLDTWMLDRARHKLRKRRKRTDQNALCPLIFVQEPNVLIHVVDVPPAHPFDIFANIDDLLELLVLPTSVDGVVHYYPVHVVIAVGGQNLFL